MTDTQMVAVLTYLCTMCFLLRASDLTSNVQRHKCRISPFTRNCPVTSAPWVWIRKLAAKYQLELQRFSEIVSYCDTFSDAYRIVRSFHYKWWFQMKTSSSKLIVEKNLLIEWITVNQYSIFCALIDCNQPAMTTLFDWVQWFYRLSVISWGYKGVHICENQYHRISENGFIDFWSRNWIGQVRHCVSVQVFCALAVCKRIKGAGFLRYASFIFIDIVHGIFVFVRIALTSNEGLGESAPMRRLARAFVNCICKVWIKMKTRIKY